MEIDYARPNQTGVPFTGEVTCLWVSIVQPPIQIINTVTNTAFLVTVPVVVGQHIQLKVQPGQGQPPISNITWTIPGPTVKSYAASTQSATWTALGPSDYTSPTIGFYWLPDYNAASCNSTSGYQPRVTVQATQNGQVQTAVASFAVYCPSNVVMNSTTSQVNILTNTPFGTVLIFESYPTPGITWHNSAAAPTNSANGVFFGQPIPGAGKITMVQLINTAGAVLSPTGCAVGTPSTSGQLWVDSAFWYKADLGAQPVQVLANNSAMWTDNDNPFISLVSPPCTDESISMQFQDYFIYKPDISPDAIWVTIGQLSWSWSGTATFNTTANAWQVVSSSVPSNPSGAAAATLPVWPQVYNPSSPVPTPTPTPSPTPTPKPTPTPTPCHHKC